MNEYYNPYGYQPPQMRQAPRQTETSYYGMPTMSAPLQNYIKGRPVTSIEEARVAQIDLDGSLYVFTDIANKRIYTKQIGQNGSAIFNVYALDEKIGAGAPLYVTRDEFNTAINQINEAFSRVAAQKAEPRAPQSGDARKQEFQI